MLQEHTKATTNTHPITTHHTQLYKMKTPLHSKFPAQSTSIDQFHVSPGPQRMDIRTHDHNPLMVHTHTPQAQIRKHPSQSPHNPKDISQYTLPSMHPKELPHNHALHHHLSTVVNPTKKDKARPNGKIPNTHLTHPFPSQGTQCTPRSTQPTEQPNTHDTHNTHSSAIYSSPLHTRTNNTHLIQNTGKTLLPSNPRPHTQYKCTHICSTQNNPTKGTTTPHRPWPHHHHKHNNETHPKEHIRCTPNTAPFPHYHNHPHFNWTQETQKTNTSPPLIPPPKTHTHTRTHTPVITVYIAHTTPGKPQSSYSHRQNIFPKPSLRTHPTTGSLRKPPHSTLSH